MVPRRCPTRTVLVEQVTQTPSKHPQNQPQLAYCNPVKDIKFYYLCRRKSSAILHVTRLFFCQFCWYFLRTKGSCFAIFPKNGKTKTQKRATKYKKTRKKVFFRFWPNCSQDFMRQALVDASANMVFCVFPQTAPRIFASI